MSKDYEFKIQSFAPDEDLTDDVSKMYMDMLDNLMKNKHVRNIAMTGDLGIGKSTLIRNYERKYENNVLNIFPNNENIKKIVMAEALNEPIKIENTDDENTEVTNTKIKKFLNKISKLYNKYKPKIIIFLSKKLPKKKYVYLSVTDMKVELDKENLQSELEERLLKQLLVICNKEEMIGSHYRPVPEKKIGLIPAILTIILSLFAAKKLECLPEIIDNTFVLVIFLVFCLFAIYYLIKKLCLHYKLPSFEFNFGGEKNNGNATAEHTEAEETLDENMTDIVYLMEGIYKKSAKVLVVEDLDRYGADICIPIIEKLREINVLVNQRIRFLHGDKEPFRFVYILKDDIFSQMMQDKNKPSASQYDIFSEMPQDENKSSVPPSKYFDGILPVVPQLGHANSADYLIGKREWNTKYNIEEDFIYDVSKYIYDYRQIRAIENEFNIFREVAKDKIKDESKINATELMAFCIYKHFYPEEYYKIRTQPEQELISYVFEKEINRILTILNKCFKNNLIKINEVKLPTDDRKKTLFNRIKINILRYLFPDNSINNVLVEFNKFAKNITLDNVLKIEKQLHKSSAYYIDFRLILAIYAVKCTSKDSSKNEEVFEFQKKLMNECDENAKNASGDNAKEKFAFYYAMALGNATAKMTDSNKIQEKAEIIKELLEKYQTPEIAHCYAAALGNATAKMTDSDKIQEKAEIIKELLEKYQTPEIAHCYAVALVNATAKTTDFDERIRLSEKIETEILAYEKYQTPEIALEYANALVNATNKMTDFDKIQEKAEIIKELLEKYQTPEIALRYAMAIVNATAKTTNSDERIRLAEKIKTEIFDKYNTPEIAHQYAMALVNATTKTTNSDERSKLAEKIKTELLAFEKYQTPEIALEYAKALYNATTKITDAKKIEDILVKIKELADEYKSDVISDIFEKVIEIAQSKKSPSTPTP